MTDTLVIDTNVLEYLFDDVTHNDDGHIDTLLERFVVTQKKLGLDQGGRIISEYNNRLQYHVKQMSDQTLRTQWLRYLLEFADRIEVGVKTRDRLGNCIASTIGHKSKVKAEISDQIFVYVASTLDCVMVSDDRGHITNHARQLRKCASAHGSSNTDFLSSKAAAAAI